jgi:hypothetical protein
MLRRATAAGVKPRSNRHEGSSINTTTLHQHLKAPNSHPFDAESQAASRDITKRSSVHAPILVQVDTPST